MRVTIKIQLIHCLCPLRCNIQTTTTIIARDYQIGDQRLSTEIELGTTGYKLASWEDANNMLHMRLY